MKWLNSHNLELNIRKSKLFQFRPYQNLPLNIQYEYKNTELKAKATAPLFGIELDYHESETLCTKPN